MKRAIQQVRAAPSRLYSKYRTFRVSLAALRKLVRKEREWKVPLRLRRPRWWLRGFLSRSAVLYEFDHGNDPREYVTDANRYFRTKNMVHPRIQDIINNKLSTHLLLGSMDIPSPELLGVCWRRLVHLFPEEGKMPVPMYLQTMDVGQMVFFKVLAGAEGKNIFAVRRATEDQWAVNGTRHDAATAARALLAQDHPMIIERGIIQHPDQEALYANSVNTIRVLTMLDVRKSGAPFIATAVQRIGCGRSEPADNWTRGGLSAPVDLTTGVLGRATRLPDRDVKEWFDDHPDTGAPIRGQVVPFWQEIHDLVLHSANVLSFMEYIGWDIVVTPDGPVVLEANINTGLNVMQAHAPLLRDARVRAYYNERGIRTGRQIEPAAPDDAPV